jgi:hypothetical protein
MPEWTLWLIPCLFTLMFAYTVALGVLRTGRARTGRDACPSRHRGAVPVEDVCGELVAWLCVDPRCGEQLPREWRLTEASRPATQPAASAAVDA